LTSIYTISREDLYDYRRCPKIVAIKAYRALRAVRESKRNVPRELEPATIGMIGEAAVRLGFQGAPRDVAMKQIAQAIPQVKFNEQLEEIASQSLKGVQEVRAKLTEEYGDLAIIGKGEGRHPDFPGKVRPDFIAFKDREKKPIIIETKDTTRMNPTDNFQASLYNGIAERYGLYLIQERLERGVASFSPLTIHGSAEAVLIYPRLAKYVIIRERFAPGIEVVKEIWKAKQLGFKGLMPETECGKKCAHTRLKVKLAEGDMEPAPPLPLIFSNATLETGFSYDVGYQVNYAWRFLPLRVKLAILMSARGAGSGLAGVKEWLTAKLGLEEEAAQIVVNPAKRDAFLHSRPDAENLMKSAGTELESWKSILGRRLAEGSPSVLAIATAIYSLPKNSTGFVRESWNRWC
jgi:hypothetical protein